MPPLSREEKPRQEARSCPVTAPGAAEPAAFHSHAVTALSLSPRCPFHPAFTDSNTLAAA